MGRKRADLKVAMSNADETDPTPDLVEQADQTEQELQRNLEAMMPPVESLNQPVDVAARNQELIRVNSHLNEQLQQAADIMTKQQDEIERLKIMFGHAMELAKEAKA